MRLVPRRVCLVPQKASQCCYVGTVGVVYPQSQVAVDVNCVWWLGILLPDEDVVVNLGLGACIGEAEDEKEEEQDEADADETTITGGDFVSKFFNCLADWAGETLGVTKLTTTKHAGFVVWIA